MSAPSFGRIRHAAGRNVRPFRTLAECAVVENHSRASMPIARRNPFREETAMNAVMTDMQVTKWRGGVRAIVAGGLIAGTVDIGAAALISHFSPATIMRFIAGGMLGKAALHGGPQASLIGLGLQWAMSLLIAAIFVAAALRGRWMLHHPVIAGLGYGAGVFFVMNYIVVPLSAWHRWPAFGLISFAENMLAMLLFGLIVAFCARRFLSSSPASPA